MAALISFARLLGAVAIAYCFVVVLMAATAQQRVGQSLEARSKAAPAAESMDYSTAWAMVQRSNAAESELKEATAQQEKASALADQAADRVGRASSAMDDAWARLQPIAERAARYDDCSVPAGKDSRSSDRVLVWNALVACRSSEQVPARLRAQIVEVTQGAGNFQAPYDAWRSALADGQEANASLSRAKTVVAARSAEVANAASIRSAFNELNVLMDSWFLGGSFLVGLPPSLMQILLSFVAGLFGALLVTLVLVVYPKSALTMSGGANVEARIFLGGLISLGVFIVLGGGAALLGSGTSFDEAKANFLTFCAVGVLAGMFSDRVAAWLSNRANAFFKTE